MSYVPIVPGDRIRLVAVMATDGDGDTHRVNLRYDWTGPSPEHVCGVIAGDCDHCDTQVARILRKRFGTEVSVASVAVIRDRQTTVAEPTVRALNAA